MIAVPWSIVAVIAIIGAVMIVVILTAGRLVDTLLWTRRGGEPEYMRIPPSLFAADKKPGRRTRVFR